MIEIKNITSIKVDKLTDFRPQAETRWDALIETSGFTPAEQQLSKQCKNRKFFQTILWLIFILGAIGSIILGLFAFLENTMILWFVICLLVTVALLLLVIFFNKKTKKMLVQNEISLFKIKSKINDEIFHESMFKFLPQVKRTTFSSVLCDKFSDYFFNTKESNTDCFIPIYLNKRNALLRSFHLTTWIQKPYYGSKTVRIGKNTQTKTVIVMWPYPVDNQYTSIIDTTSLAKDLGYVTSEVKLGSERAIEKFNKKNKIVSLENNDFNRLFPNTRTDEQQFRVIFDLVTQENIANVIKELGPIGSYKNMDFISIYKKDYYLRTFSPTSTLITKPKFYFDLKKDFIYYYTQTIKDFENLVAAYLSFSCFAMENEKEYGDHKKITDFEVEQILYQLSPFGCSYPPKSKKSDIHHFNFSRLENTTKNSLCTSVDFRYMFSVKKIVRKEGTNIEVDDYHYLGVGQYVVFYTPKKDAELNEFKTEFCNKIVGKVIDNQTSFSIAKHGKYFVISFLRNEIEKQKIDQIIKLL